MSDKTWKIFGRSGGVALWSRRFPPLHSDREKTPSVERLRSRKDARPIALLGVPFDNVTTQETIELIEGMVASRQPHYLATANVDFLVQAMHDVELRRILLDAHLVLCDGTPLLWASKLMGNPLPERVAGSDLIPLLLNIASQKKYRVFFLGGTPDSTGKAVMNLRAKHPDLEIAGHYSPPFASLLEMNHDEIVFRIREAQPDLLLVSFGCPKQEKWISMHYRNLGVPVCVGVGATIDFLAGTVKRAPKIMQKTGTEWLFRLAQEPRRLFRRYTNDLFWISIGISQQWWKMRFESKRSLPSVTAVPNQISAQFQSIKAPKRLDLEAVHRDASLCEETISQSQHCLLELDQVEFIDSTGVGLLIRLQKKTRAQNGRLILIAPSRAVEAALKLMRLRDFFTVCPNLEEARQLMNEAPPTPVYILPDQTATKPVLFWRGEVTSANAPEVWQTTLQFLNSRARKEGEACIDLSSLQFIDSTGVSLMLRAKKNARQQGIQLRFAEPQPNVRNVLRVSRLESLLIEEAA